MFQTSQKTMRWTSLLKDIKEKVGLTQSQPQPVNAFAAAAAAAASGTGTSGAPDSSSTPYGSPSSSPARGKYELELDFKRFWEEFRSSSSEKEKEAALNTALDAFCILVKQQYDVVQLVTKLVEAHIFSFVVGRAFVTDVEKLRMYSKGRSLQVSKVINFFSNVAKNGMKTGSNLLYAVEVLVTGPFDKQPLLDSGILCCLIQILNALLNPDESSQRQFVVNEAVSSVISGDGDNVQVHQLEVEGSVVHIMKALASHPSAAPSLIEDDSLQLLFSMVTNGSLNVFSQFKDGLVRLHTIQLHRHAMQILGLLLTNDNGSTVKYIHKHHLIKVLLTAVRDFNPEKGDPAYTVGIIDLLLECVELSSKPEAGQIRLKEDIHNAHGYQYLVQFALKLSYLLRNPLIFQSANPDFSFQNSDSNSQHPSTPEQEFSCRGDLSQPQLSPTLTRLLDVLVNLAQIGPADPSSGIRGSKSSYGKASHSRSRASSGEKFGDDMWDKGNMMIKDLEAIQMLQDIFLKADNVELQAEVLNRMFKIFSSHLENYRLCQQLRTVPLFILNMAGFPASFQEIILKILEYAVTVVNCIPEQELLSLCCLLQQPISTDLKHTILAFFVKLLSFDQQYKKVLREVGVLDVLLDDLRKHKFISGTEQLNKLSNAFEKMLNSSSFKKHMEGRDAILSSPRLVGSGSLKFLIFEDESTIAVAWDCLASLLKKAEGNQQFFRSNNGVSTVLPFLALDSHRSGVLRLLACLIIEDSSQAHHEELGSLVEILKSGMVTTVLGSQYKLENDAKCEIFGTLWRILGSNNSAQRVFGEATGFSLLLTTLHSFQSSDDATPHSFLIINTKIFSFLLRVITAGVCNNPINRVRLHTILSSKTFFDLLCESGLLCVDCEKQVIQFLLELALEIVTAPSLLAESGLSFDTFEDEFSFLSNSPLAVDRTDKERVYNASAVGVLIQSLLLLTPKVQLEVLKLIEKLARASPFNQESLISIGSVELLLEMVKPFLASSSPLLFHTMQIVEILGAYRLSTSELQILLRYVVQMKVKASGRLLVDMLEKLIHMEDMRVHSVSLAPFVEMDMSKVGYASVQVSLGERMWPPAAGYSFVCWFQFRNFLKSQAKDSEPSHKTGLSRRSISGGVMLRFFSVGAADDGNTFYAELCLQDNGILTLATSSSCSLSFPGVELDERRWHHLAVVHSKPSALAGLFQSSVAYLYLDGKLRHTGKLGYSPSPIGKSLQVTLGSPITCAKVTDFSWRLGSCYLFEEVLTAGNICFMYILGQGYRGLFQDTNLLQFVPSQACGGGTMAILDSLDELSLSANVQKVDSSTKHGNPKIDGSGIVWDLERLARIALQLSGKKLIFSFDGTPSDAFQASGTLSLLNLVDPTSAAASPIGGIPRYGRFNGDIYICNKRVIGDTLRTIGGMAIVLFLVEAAESKEMLYMALELLACSLHQCSQNVQEMQAMRGYHLLALFLHRRMPLFDLPSLEIFFQIAACEACFTEPQKYKISRGTSFPSGVSTETSLDNFVLPKFSDEISSIGSQGDLDEFSIQKDSFSHVSELENSEFPEENSNCIVLSNADMVEHVLLDWTLWVTAPVSIQIALLGFLERLVSMHWYRSHNLTILRRINLVQHLLVTLQRGDVEVPVLEKLVVLLGVILEDGFLASELELVVRFVIMTFDPPALVPHNIAVRETMGKHIIVRNMLLEMLIDLQVTISSEELLEQWHKIVSSKLITYFLDEAVHPTSMRWIMTLLGVCLASSPTFALKFRSSGGFQGLTHVLPSFYDSPEIYYILFCLIFGKAVYPRVPEVRMLDFHALVSSDGNYGELKFVDLLESVVVMVRNTFDRLSTQVMLAHQNDNLSHLNSSLISELVEATTDMGDDLQGEALMHKTYAARLMGGEAAAPSAAMSVLRFMVDLAKMCPPFSAICRRLEFIESCVDLYFSCVRADCAMKMAKNFKPVENAKNMNENDDNLSSHNTFMSLPVDQEQSCKTSVSLGSFPQEQKSTSSEDTGGLNILVCDADVKTDSSFNLEPTTSGETSQDLKVSENLEIWKKTSISGSPELKFHDSNGIADIAPPLDSLISASVYPLDSPVMSEKSSSKVSITPASPALALTSWLGSISSNDAKAVLPVTSPIGSSVSIKEFDASPDVRAVLQYSSAANMYFPINTKLLLEIDDSGYGGGPCSAAATAILDFIAEVLADIVAEQLKATQFLESVLEAVPLYVDIDSALVFQGLCLGRLLNFLERRLLRDDEENEQKLEKTRWSVNLDSLCWLIVDRVYMGSFPQPVGVLRTLEFLLSMLQLANKDGRIQDASPAGKGLLYITRGNKQLETYIHSILKNTNRMIMYCFMPSFLSSIAEDEFIYNLGFLPESGRISVPRTVQDESTISVCTALQLVVANKRLILCPSNLDTDLVCCFCINLISLLRDKRKAARDLAVDIFKHLLLHRRPALEDLLLSKPNQGKSLDVLHGGFDKLLTGNLSTFFDWFLKSEQTINAVLEQCATIMWAQYVTGSAKFPGVRIKGMEVRRKREMARKSRDASKFDLRHFEQMTERRYALELVRDLMATELRVMRQDKFGWVLHAESEWHTHLQQLVHERGIFSIHSHFAEPEWQLCPIEGPYRMRKKLEHCSLKLDILQSILTRGFGPDDSNKLLMERPVIGGLGTPRADPDTFFNLLSENIESKFDEDDEESLFKDLDEFKADNPGFAQSTWTDDQCSSVNEPSFQFAQESGVWSTSGSARISEIHISQSDAGSVRQSSSMNEKSEKELHDNGEYLIRPYLEPLEKIRFKYNCERVVGLDKHDGIFLIGDLCLYVIENFYIEDSGSICEKEAEDELSVIDQALGVKKDTSGGMEFQPKSHSGWGIGSRALVGGRAWAYNGGAWGKERVCTSGSIPHSWHMWKLDNVYELVKRDYQLRPVAVEIFSMDGCNDLLVFHKKEREEVFRYLVAMNLPRNSMLDATISGTSKQEGGEGGRLFKSTAKSFSKRWQNRDISNFQYLMHLNTLAGRGYSDLTQYPVFPWVLANYESEFLDLFNPKSFRKLDKPMGCQTPEGEDEFKKRYESWDDPEVPKFHYGSHYSSAGIVLFYLLRLPPFSTENQTLQGGQFDHADRLFNSVRDTWLSAAGRGNTSDVKELIPEFFYLPEFLENRFNLDLGEKQSGEKVGDVILPPWAKGSAREFIRKHREALESDYVSENLHHWIDLIFGYKQRGKAAEDAVNVFYHYTYEGSVDIDAVPDPGMKASILAQINHFGQTPKQLFLKPHLKRRRSDRKTLLHPLRFSAHLAPHEIRKSSSPISQIITFHDKVLTAAANSLLKPTTHSKYIAWGFPDRSLRIMSYDQDRLLSTHENLHGGNQIQCAGMSHDGQTLVTGGDDGVVSVWRFSRDTLRFQRSLCAHTSKVTCLCVSQPYTLVASGSNDRTVILWDLASLSFVKQLPEFPSPVSAVHINDLTGEILTAAGVLLGVWSINGDCLAVVNTSQLPSDLILSASSAAFSDWQDTNWFVTGHQSGAVKVWNMVHCSGDMDEPSGRNSRSAASGLEEYRLLLHKVLKSHKHPVTALHIPNDLKQLLSGDSAGHLLSWTLADDILKASFGQG